MDGGVDGTIYAVEIFNSELYIGGEFTLADGTPTGGLAKWSGSNWVPAIGGGTDGGVDDMTVYAGQLIVCGNFYEVGGGTFAGGIAGWNGSTWHDLNGGSESGAIYRIDADANHLYATGYFEGIGNAFVNNIARWNGTSWSAMGSGLTDEFFDPYEASGEFIYTWNGMVAVTGTFARAGGQALSNFAIWDGTSWGTLGSNPDEFAGGAYTIGELGGELHVYNGYSEVWNWNGFFWDSQISGGYFSSMGEYGNALVLGGRFRSLNGVPVSNLGLFDGTNSLALASGNGVYGPVDVVHEWNGQLVVAGGGQTVFGSIANEMLATWDGSQWQSLGGGVYEHPASYTVDMESYQGDLVVAGIFNTAGGAPISRFARWDGTTWSQVGDASPTGAGDMEVVDGELFALANIPGQAVAKLDDLTNTWQYIGDNSPGHVMASLGQYNGQLIAAGNFPDIEGVAAQGIATWNGTTWAPLGAGIVGTVNGMAELGGKLYVAGVFSMAGGSPAVHTAVWDGLNWSPMGSGLGNRAFHLEEFNGDIYVTGEMTSAGGNPASYIARWDGAAWQAMGSGLNGFGQDIAAVNGQLFVGGDFSVAGAQFSAGIAEWTLGTVSAVGPFNPNTLALAPGAPNPFNSGTTFFFELNSPGDVRVEIFDVRGRRVSQRTLSGLGTGQHSFSWNGRDRRGRQTANGTYFVQVKTARQQAMRRVTLLQ